MALGQADVALYNAAMDELGGTPINAFDDATPAADGSERRYRNVRNFCLGLRAWSWQTTRAQLARLEAPSPTHFAYQYTLPEGKVMAVYTSADTDRPTTQFTLQGGKLHTNFEQIWITHDGLEPDPGTWSASFTAAVQKALAASACMQVTGDKGLRATLHAEAYGSPSEHYKGGLMGVAISEDSKSEPGTGFSLDAGDLIRARY